VCFMCVCVFEDFVMCVCVWVFYDVCVFLRIL